MTVASDRLTEAHRVAQARYGAQTVALVAELFVLLDLEDLDGSIPRWLAAIQSVVAGNRTQAEALSRRYLQQHRRILAPTASLLTAEADELIPGALRTSMLVTGPYRLRKKLSTGSTAAQATSVARAGTAGEAMRFVLGGGRSLIDNAVNTDEAILGVQRRTSGAPCHFCAMLASRGPVYKSEATARFQPHAGCSCQPEPVYQDRAPLTAQALVEREKWDEAKRLAPDEGVSEAVMFRRIHEGRIAGRKPAAKKTSANRPVAKRSSARRANAGDLTAGEGQRIADSANRLARGEISAAEHRRNVRDITGTDSRGRRR